MSSFVKKVVHKPSGEIMAIKVLKQSREQDPIISLCRELTILRYSYSPYFLEFYGATVYVNNNLSKSNEIGGYSCDHVNGVHGSWFFRISSSTFRRNNS